MARGERVGGSVCLEASSPQQLRKCLRGSPGGCLKQGEEDGIPVTQHGCASRAQHVSPGMGTAPEAHKSPHAWQNQNQNLHPADAQQGPKRPKSHPEDGEQLPATSDPCRVLAAAPSPMPRRRPRSVPRHGHGALTATICQAWGQTPQNPNPNPAQAARAVHSRKGLRPPWLRCRYQRHDNRLEIFGGRERRAGRGMKPPRNYNKEALSRSLSLSQRRFSG